MAVTGITKVNAAFDIQCVNFEMRKGASVRIGNNEQESGLRYYVGMSEENYLSILNNIGDGKIFSEVTYGMFIVPYDYLTEGYELTVENLFGVSAKFDADNTPENVSDGKKAITKIESEQLYSYTDDENHSSYGIYGSLVGLLKNNYTRQFVGLGYIRYKTSEAEDYSYILATSNDNVRSMTYVAQGLIADGSVSSQDIGMYITDSSNVKSTYLLKEYYQSVDGKYVKVTDSTVESTVGAVIEQPEVEGYCFNEALSNGSATVFANNLSSVERYYDNDDMKYFNNCETGDYLNGGSSIFFGIQPQTVVGWDGNAISCGGNGGNIFIGNINNKYYGGISFEAGKTFLLNMQMSTNGEPTNKVFSINLKANDGLGGENSGDVLGSATLNFENGYLNQTGIAVGSFVFNESLSCYDISVRFTCPTDKKVTIDCGPGWGGSEADGTNYYNWIFDNICISELQTISAVYTAGSNAIINVNSSVDNILIDNAALDKEQWSYADNKIVLFESWLASVSSQTLTVCYKNGWESIILVKTNLLYFNDCENGDKYASGHDSIFKEKGSNALTTVEGWDGKALSYSGNGGDMFFGYTLWGIYGVGAQCFETGGRYMLSMQMKVDESKTPTNTSFGIRIHKNDGTLAPNTGDTLALTWLNFTDGTYSIDDATATDANFVVSFTKTESGYYNLTITFTCYDSAVNLAMYPGWNGSATGCVYAWLFDNIKVIKVS